MTTSTPVTYPHSIQVPALPSSCTVPRSNPTLGFLTLALSPGSSYAGDPRPLHRGSLLLELAARSPTSYLAETTVPHPQSGLPSLHPLQYLPYLQFRVVLPPSPTPGLLPLFRSFLSPLSVAPVVIRGTVYLHAEFLYLYPL